MLLSTPPPPPPPDPTSPEPNLLLFICCQGTHPIEEKLNHTKVLVPTWSLVCCSSHGDICGFQGDAEVE